MPLTDDWDSVIDPAELQCFVGREHEMEMFQREINSFPPRYLVFYISGQGGVGKTTLLNRYKETAQNMDCLMADCDEQQRDIPTVLGRFAQLLREHGVTFKHFDERYKVYRQKMHEIENDPEAPQGVAALIGRTVVRASYIAGDILPGIRKGLEFLPRETIETQASEWATYLAKKLTNKDEVLLLREPVSVMAPLFFRI